MYINQEIKKDIFKTHGKSESDTGAAESQIALFTHRISHLTKHLKANKKDKGTQRALINLVGKRRRLLDFLKDNEINRYREIIKKLNLRK
jgi:small subunit ribosomal protein S15